MATLRQAPPALPRLILAIFLGACSLIAQAQLSIEITGAGAQRIPVAIATFPGEGALGATPNTPAITQVERADLERSGLFRTLELPPLNPHPTEASNISYPEWRSRL